jgi:hypothetical protein
MDCPARNLKTHSSPSAADIPLLAYLFERALEAHPKSQELLILHLVFLRFVFRDAQSAAYREKVTKRINSELRTDLKFALYAGQHPRPASLKGLDCNGSAKPFG